MKRSTQRTAARERDRRLRGLLGEELWNVASEPGCRSAVREMNAEAAVGIHGLSPLKDRRPEDISALTSDK